MRRGLLAAIPLALVLTGCALFEVARQNEQLGQIAVIQGSVRAESGKDAPLVVVLARDERAASGDAEDWKLVDYVVRDRPGPFWFRVRPGRYRLGAYQDLDADLRYDPTEPAAALRGDPVLEIARGQRSEGHELVIPTQAAAITPLPVDIAEAVDRSAVRDQAATLRAVLARGEVRALDDPRFLPAQGQQGLWRPADFLRDARPGLYFLEPHRADRIPVLFIHGVGGTPAIFAPLVDALDRERFEAWFFFYPSGLPLSSLGKALASQVIDLELRERLTRMAVVGYSMGGLLARSFLIERAELSDRPLVPLFVSIATPFGGSSAAEGAASGSGLPPGAALPLCFRDLAPSSAFLHDLFFVPLPPGTRHHLLFAYRRKTGRRGPSSDGIVDLSSQLRPEAQREAASVFGVDADHIAILSDPATSERVNALLAETFSGSAPTARSARP